jgi:homoserine dehydrogenase
LTEGYRSVTTTSLVPPELEDVKTGDEFIRRLPEFDAQFDEMRKQAAEEGFVLRFVGVINVESGKIKVDLARYLYTSYIWALSD